MGKKEIRTRKMTQHQRILQLHENREWVCQAEYRNISWCPHKRRTDICEGRAKDLEGNRIPAGTYYFDWKECEHEIKGSRDYLLINRVKPLEPSCQGQQNGIDYDNIYDALGRPDLNPQEEKLNL